MIPSPVAHNAAIGTEDGPSEREVPSSQEFMAEERSREFMNLPEVGYTNDLEALQRQFAEEWSLRAQGPLRPSALVAGGVQGPTTRAEMEECSSSPPACFRQPRSRYTTVVGRDARA